MNKLSKILLSFLFITLCGIQLFADSGIIVISSTQPAYGIRARVKVSGNGIQHNAINAISSLDKFLNAKVKVNFGVAESVNMKLKYYINGDKSNIIEVEKGNIYHNTPFYISSDIDAQEGDVINYQLEGVFTYRDASKSTEISTKTFCWPTDSSENPYYQAAVVTNSVSATPSNGKIILESGDQSKKDTSLTIPEEYSSETFVIEERPVDEYIEPAKAAANSVKVVNPNKPVKLFHVKTSNGSAFEDVVFNISYSDLTSRDNFTLKTGTELSTITENVPVTSVNLSDKIVSAKINKSGYYALFTDVKLLDSDYRPAKRVIVKARAQSRGDVFAFNYLKDGDSVKIYNVNGRKVRTITSGTDEGFRWDGKNDSGQYVESGTYVYQIKVKGKSKLISGTIAFVK